MKLATRIELIVTITKRSSTITQAQYDNELSCMDKWLSEQVSLSSSISCLVCHLTERQKNSFELALMSALRNAIQHMWDKYLSTNVSGTMSIAATVEDNRKRIIITNTVVLRGFSSFTQGKNEGTKMSIQGYVGNYHPAASDLVKITRINQRQREDNFFEEEWKTVLPLPETTVVLGSDYVSSLHV